VFIATAFAIGDDIAAAEMIAMVIVDLVFFRFVVALVARGRTKPSHRFSTENIPKIGVF
jgi:hypothetical protein